MRLSPKIDNPKSSSFALTLTLNSNRLRFIFYLLLYIVLNIRILFEYYSNNIREYKYYLSNICEYEYRLEYSNIANITTEAITSKSLIQSKLNTRTKDEFIVALVVRVGSR